MFRVISEYSALKQVLRNGAGKVSLPILISQIVCSLCYELPSRSAERPSHMGGAATEERVWIYCL